MQKFQDALDKLNAQVAKETAVDESIKTLVEQQGALLKSQVPDMTQAQSDAFDAAIAKMADNATGITASVVANTPAAGTDTGSGTPTGDTGTGDTGTGNTSAGGTASGG